MNVEVTVKNTTKEAFDAAMRLIFLDVFSYGGPSNPQKVYKCIGYKIENNQLFLSEYSEKCTLFPYKFDIQQTIDFAWGWFQNNQVPTEKKPSTDGSTEVAFELTTVNCGMGSKDWGLFASLKPIWFVYGK